jgi:hypothetical protein
MQKIAPKSSTEAELAGLSDSMAQAIHLFFVENQGYSVDPVFFNQELSNAWHSWAKVGPDPRGPATSTFVISGWQKGWQKEKSILRTSSPILCMQIRSHNLCKRLSLKGRKRASPAGLDIPRTQNRIPYERSE